jgi:hypothetical protein
LGLKRKQSKKIGKKDRIMENMEEGERRKKKKKKRIRLIKD